MRDVHAMVPTGGLHALNRVGITGVRKPLNIHRGDGVHVLAASFSVFVDLPETRKGSDLSRNAQVLAEIVDTTVVRPSQSLEDVTVAIAQELLQRHSYATRALVRSEAEYFMNEGVSPEKSSFEDFTLIGEAEAVRTDSGIDMTMTIGAEAVGMTACPCAMETCRASLEKEYPLLKDPTMLSMPIITHNQRNRTRLSLTVPQNTSVEAEDILKVIASAQSSPTYAILKRVDEGAVVLDAHRNPKFVEDVVRAVLNLAVAAFRSLPDSTLVHVRTESEESIHKYNVMAEHSAILGDLRSNLSQNGKR